jgi:hypothetical protein
LCPDIRLAVDAQMAAYHLGYVDLNIPDDAISIKDSASLYQILRDRLVRKGRVKPKSPLNFELCQKHGCSHDLAENAKKSRQFPLECRMI